MLFSESECHAEALKKFIGVKPGDVARSRPLDFWMNSHGVYMKYYYILYSTVI